MKVDDAVMVIAEGSTYMWRIGIVQKVYTNTLSFDCDIDFGNIDGLGFDFDELFYLGPTC